MTVAGGSAMALDVRWLANKAADVIAARGLWKGEMCKDPDDLFTPVCVLGAACVALTGKPDMAPDDDTSWLLMGGLCAALKPHTGPVLVGDWNDNEYVTTSRVVTVLRKIGAGE
jgi:hypothetical protein